MHVAAFEHLLEEESQRRNAHLHGAGREFPFLQQVPLESLNLCKRLVNTVWCN